jgi:hypothetical protein
MKFSAKKLISLVFAAGLAGAFLPVHATPTANTPTNTLTLRPGQKGQVVLSLNTTQAQDDARWLAVVDLSTLEMPWIKGELVPIGADINKGAPGTTNRLVGGLVRGPDWVAVAMEGDEGKALGFTMALPRIKRDLRATKGIIFLYQFRIEYDKHGERADNVIFHDAYSFCTLKDVVTKEELLRLPGRDGLKRLMAAIGFDYSGADVNADAPC